MAEKSPGPVKLRLALGAEQYLVKVEQRRRAIMEAVLKLPLAVVVWGPGPNQTSAAAFTRLQLRDELIRNGHIADFSEDLIDPESPLALPVQQLAHVEAADLVLSIPDSIGSFAEIHDFARLPAVANKIIAFLNREWADNYSSRSLVELQSQATCAVEPYDATNLPGCIIERAMEHVRRLQQLHFFQGRRV